MRAASPLPTPRHDPPPAVRVLSCHAEYRCRHAGACCTSGWPIPVESTLAPQLHAAVRDGALQPVGGTDVPALLFPVDAPVDTPALLGRVGDQCVFFGTHGTGRCEVHAALGHHALPLACRQFPRVTVRDPRGASVTLSHYCPTAASLLQSAVPVHIVTNAAAFPPEGEHVGLDATGALPPLLRPGVLMDWESWWEFERLTVQTIAESSPRPGEIIDRLRAVVDDIRTWMPGDGELIARVRQEFASDRRPVLRSSRPPLAPFATLALDAVPEALKARADIGGQGPVPPNATRGFLAAHAFANWTAHLGQGLRSWLRTIEIAGGLIEAGADIPRADLILRHLADPHALADVASRAEQE